MKEQFPIFHKIAGSRQLAIKNVQDLSAAVALDPAHWAMIRIFWKWWIRIIIKGSVRMS